ncbi:hypothetical protein EJ02DRAFT_458449 [Clathrospora elynae]|uniref:Uncharacterized protein n=1 Tax=Clathrospora elynae TaxID=706981 RepID=A0A6A5SGY9_9PLEO|nr:hypothetical protein EJ02DRAFT_458449 [Clathrospora elynae]
MGEKAAIGLLCAGLLFKGEAEDGEEKMYSVPEVNLNRAYLPLAPGVTVTADIGKLTQPRLDTAIAYITSQAAELTDIKPALMLYEERTLAKVPLSGKLHFPFLTCQWNSLSGNETHYHASLQGAHDGAFARHAESRCGPRRRSYAAGSHQRILGKGANGFLRLSIERSTPYFCAIFEEPISSPSSSASIAASVVSIKLMLTGDSHRYQDG